MLLGIHEDTGSLTYPGTTPYDADAVAFLMAAGADLEVVNQFLVRTLTAEQRRLLDTLLEHARGLGRPRPARSPWAPPRPPSTSTRRAS